MIHYQPDILENGFEQTTLNLNNDYEGKVVATIIRKKASQPTKKAVLYIHGFNDYFFQEELAQQFNQNNYDFYALDLRKYGRSYRPHQKFNNVRDLSEYDEELLKTIEIITSENHDHIVLNGHSNGGLIISYFLTRQTSKNIKSAILNSPFYGLNFNIFMRKVLAPMGCFIGKFFPNLKSAGGFSKLYGVGLHKDYQGNWNYNLDWKPHLAPKINFGFIRAIYLAQQYLKKGGKLNVPMLIMHSDTSTYRPKKLKQVHNSDIILNIKHIKQVAKSLIGDITITDIPNGVHDLVLSKKPVRKQVYKVMFNFLDHI